jgi:NTP pyrophosphatase (non-canonical NTP hydrolase)
LSTRTANNYNQSMSKTTLADYQDLVKKLVVERGFDKETVPEVFTLLVEEVGELAKAIRKANGQKVDKARRQHDVEEEAADVFWLLIDLCNRLDIDLAKAFEAKEKINQKRKWD